MCHADYSIPSNIKIEFYADRVEITNPGGIYRYNIDDILLGIQSFRNPKLIAVLHRLGFIENYGTGIKRIKEAYPNHNIKDFLINSRQWFRVALPDLNRKETSLEDNVPQNVPQNVPHNDLGKIINAIKKNERITREELASIIGKSVKTVARIIKESNSIKFVGSSKTGHWEIVENDKKD